MGGEGNIIEKTTSICSGRGNVASKIWFGHELDASKSGSGPKRCQRKF